MKNNDIFIIFGGKKSHLINETVNQSKLKKSTRHNSCTKLEIRKNKINSKK